MDIIGPIAVIVVCIIIFSLCGWCCRRKREGTVYGQDGKSVSIKW